jgi:hypothetical protein
MSEEQLELAYLRRVLEEIIEITIFDMTDERKFKSKSNRNEQARNKAEALAFVQCSTFEVVCDAVGVPACRVRKKCLS